jgi:protein kinase C substrate 80K-H
MAAGSGSEARKQAHQRAETALRDAEVGLENERRALEKLFDEQYGFGPQGEWKKLDQTCISYDTGECVFIEHLARHHVTDLILTH